MLRLGMARGIAISLAIAFSLARTSLAQDPDEVSRLDAQAFALYEQGKRQEGVALAEQALALAERLYGAESPQLSPIIANLVALYTDIGRYSEAEALAKRNLQI